MHDGRRKAVTTKPNPKQRGSCMLAQRQLFVEFAQGKAAEYSPTYAFLAARLAADDDLLRPTAGVRSSRLADLYLAAVQFLVREQRCTAVLPLFEVGLAAYPSADDAWKTYAEFCH